MRLNVLLRAVVHEHHVCPLSESCLVFFPVGLTMDII